MTRFFSLHWDFVGFWASLLCALHCVVMPLVLSFGVFVGAQRFMNSYIDWFFIVTSFAIASWSLIRSYLKEHQNILPLLIAGLGFLGLFLAFTIIFFNGHFLLPIGGVLIAYAHFYNWQLVHYTHSSKEKGRNWIWVNPVRVISIILIMVFFIGFHGAIVHDDTPPSREEMLQVVWRIKR